MLTKLFILLLFIPTNPLAFSQSKDVLIEPESLQIARSFATDAELFVDLYFSVRTLANLADTLWEVDKIFARSLVQTAVDRVRLDSSDDKQRTKALNGLALRVARHDAELAQEVIEHGANFKMAAIDKSNSYQQMSRSFLDSSPEKASTFAAQSIQTSFRPVVVHLLNSLRNKDAQRADELFFQTLTQFKLQPSPRMEDFLYLGNYIYASYPPGNNLPDGVSVTVIGGVQVAYFPYERAEASPTAKTAYLQTAIGLLTRPSVPPVQRAAQIAAGMQLLPRIRQFRPEVVPDIELALRSQRQYVPAELFDETILKNLHSPKKEISLDERAARLDKPASDLERNLDCLVLAREAANREQFELMESIAGKARDKELSESLQKLAAFLKLKKKIKEGSLTSPIEILRSTNPGIERVSALLFLSQTATSSNKIELAREASRSALGQLENVSDTVKPRIMLAALKAFDCEEAQRWMFPLFAALSSNNSPTGDFIIRLNVGTIARSFLLLEQPKLADGLRNVILCDPELVATAIGTLKDEDSRGEIMTTIIQALLQKEKKIGNLAVSPLVQSQPAKYKVAEKSIRRIIIKKVMPAYPVTSVKNKTMGVGVAKILIDIEGKVTQTSILQTPDKLIALEIEKAARQWVFDVTKSEGRPVLVESFLTFYFSIESGKGVVRDPKLFSQKK